MNTFPDFSSEAKVSKKITSTQPFADKLIAYLFFCLVAITQTACTKLVSLNIVHSIFHGHCFVSLCIDKASCLLQRLMS